MIKLICTSKHLYSHGKTFLIFSCEDGFSASPNVCVWVFVCPSVCRQFSRHQTVHIRMIQNVPECSRMYAECSRMFQNASGMLQNVTEFMQNVPEFMQNVPECMQNVPECSKMHADLLACSYMSLHAVTWACMQLHKLAYSYISLHAVP